MNFAPLTVSMSRRPKLTIDTTVFKKTSHDKETIKVWKRINKKARRNIYGASYTKYLNTPEHQDIPVKGKLSF